MLTKKKIIKNIYLLKPSRFFLINNDPPIKLLSFITMLSSLFTSREKLENKARKNIGLQNIIFLKTGRLGIYLFLKSIKIKPGDEVIISAFNCLVVPEAVILSGATPVYVDNSSYDSINLEELKNKINSKTKCIIIPVIDGYSGNMETIFQICQEFNIYSLIDAAHTSIVPYIPKLEKYFLISDGIIQSFSHSKIFSLKSGGILYIRDKKILKNAEEEYHEFKMPKRMKEFLKISSLLLSRLIGRLAFVNIIYRIYDNLLVDAEISQEEFSAKMDKHFAEKMSKIKLSLLSQNINKLNVWNEARRNYCMKYYNALAEIPGVILFDPHNDFTPLHFTILVSDADKLFQYLQTNSIYVERWFYPILYPEGFSEKNYSFSKYDYPNSYKLSEEVINLPTSPLLSDNQINSVINAIKIFYKSNLSN